jgi:5-methylcytosine-specific restriction endonuclease McrBC GTP-binding regulatory subunit McrB
MSLQTHLQSSGLMFNEDNVIDLYLALKTAPITIFTGISGSGKTKLAQYFSEYMCIPPRLVGPTGTPAPPITPSEKHRMEFVSVRPDWLDNKGMLGYFNPLLGVYNITPVLQLILNAINEPNEPFFLLLDEMNLAKAEHYFSDFLSALESRKYSPLTGTYEAEKISLHNAGGRVISRYYDDEKSREDAITEMNSFPDEYYVHVTPTLERIYYVPEKIEIPPNLYVIGTVNIDESTYRFSPKVIDRAHVIEMNGASTADYIAHLIRPVAPTTGITIYTSLDFNVEDLTHNRRFLSSRDEAAILADTTINQAILREALSQLGSILENTPFRFSYRTANRILHFIANGKELWDNSGVPFDDNTLKKLLDHSILIKVLPRIHGQRRLLENILRDLLYFCRSTFSSSHFNDVINDRIPEDFKGTELLPYVEGDFRFPRTAKALHSVYNSLVKVNVNYGSFI